MMMAITVSRLRQSLRGPGLTHRASIVVPFVVILAALLILSYRSVQLSVRMEKGLSSVAVQYLEYAAEITAQKTNAATRAEMFRVSEQWQQVERAGPRPSFEALRRWVKKNPWIVSAMYVPDDNPAASVYVSQEVDDADSTDRLTSEFYTASGSVRYTYDPLRLLQISASSIWQTPLTQSSKLVETRELHEHSSIRLVHKHPTAGLHDSEVGPSFTVALAAPLNEFSIEASLDTGYLKSSWQSHRVISLWIVFVAVVVVAIGTGIALRGIRKEAEATQLRGALIANVSHELRTPLSMIRLGAETLKRNTKLTPRERADLEESILREVLHLSHLVENVLDVARLQRGSQRTVLSRVDPVQLVRSVISAYDSWISSKGFEVHLELDLSITEQLWDREAISRALVNLIDNAIKYSDKEKKIEVLLSQTSDSVILSVHDHGIGIKPADVGRIFDPYFRAEFSDTQTKRGAGLGLTLVQQIVTAHGGRVEVQSTPGTGSTFRMIFPKANAAEPAIVAGPISEPTRV